MLFRRTGPRQASIPVSAVSMIWILPAWEKVFPKDAMGPVSEAAGVLFSEFNRLGVLEAQFYEDDSIFAARKKYETDPQLRARFDQQLNGAEDLAKARLSRDGHDHDTLLAMTLSNGLRSDFA